MRVAHNAADRPHALAVQPGDIEPPSRRRDRIAIEQAFPARLSTGDDVHAWTRKAREIDAASGAEELGLDVLVSFVRILRRSTWDATQDVTARRSGSPSSPQV